MIVYIKLLYAKLNYPDLLEDINIRSEEKYLTKRGNVDFNEILEKIEERK